MYVVNSMFESRTLRAGPRGLGRLGDTSTSQVQVDTTDVLNLGDSLRTAQSRLNNILDQMRQDPALAQAIGPDVTAQQAQLGDLTSKYVYVYTAIFGQPPAGLGNPVLIIAAVAVVLAYVTATLYVWHQKQDAIEAQAQAQVLAENNRASIISIAAQTQQQANAAAAAGDQSTADAANQQALALLQSAGIPGTAPPPPPPPPSSTNWILVGGIAAAAVLVLPNLIK